MNAEQQIDGMLLKGSAILQDAIELYRPVAIVAAFSGGNDSIVSTHFAMTNADAFVCHINTGIGIEKTREHARKVAADNRWEFREQHAPEGEYERFVRTHGFPGPPQHGRMYQRLKERALRVVTRDLKAGHSRRSNVLIVSGIRHDESAIRAGYKRGVQKEGSRVWVNPFYFNTKLDFELYRQEFGLPRNPVSDLIGFSGECLCGAYAADGEIEAVRRVDPAVVERIETLEAEVKDAGIPACKWGVRPPAWAVREAKDLKAGQRMLFRPMCVGCNRRTA